MNLKYLISIISFVVLLNIQASAQSEYYTLIQGGGNIGIANPGYQGNFNGYSIHFIFGRNFNEQAYLGIGLGNEKLTGEYVKVGDSNNQKYQYDRNLFPVFLDARLPVSYVGDASSIGVLANAGYAMKISGMYDRGLTGKLGMFYILESRKRSEFTISASYAYQQLTYPGFMNKMNHQSVNVSVGILLK